MTEDDSRQAIGAGLEALLGDDALSRRMGANARAAAEREYDWRLIGARLADDLLECTASRFRLGHRPASAR